MPPPKSIFEVPKLTEAVAEYLTPYSIAQCVRVSRNLRLRFAPLLYQRLAIQEPMEYSTDKEYDVAVRRIESLAYIDSDFAKALRRHLQDIQDLTVTVFAEEILNTVLAETEPSAADNDSTTTSTEAATTTEPTTSTTTDATPSVAISCKNLRRLEIYVGPEDGGSRSWITGSSSPNLQILTLLDMNPNLSVLSLPAAILKSSTACERLFKSLQTCLPRLEKLTLVGDDEDPMPRMPAMELIWRCLCSRSLQELECYFEMSTADHLGESSALSKMIVRIRQDGQLISAESRLRTLVVPQHLPLNHYTRIILSSPRTLTKLRIPWVSHETATKFVDIIHTRSLNIRHIFGGNTGNHLSWPMSNTVAAFLRACKGPSVGSGLRVYHASYLLCHTPIVDALLEHHGTLEEIVIPLTGYISSNSIQRLLSACGQLTKFGLQIGGKNVCETRLSYADMLQTSWVCTNLRVLRLTLSSNVDRACRDEDDESLMRECLDGMYSRIGAMRNLVELGLDIDPKFRRHDGEGSVNLFSTSMTIDLALRHLQGLKKLRRLAITKRLWAGMGREECEFMKREWPKLQEIEFIVSEPQDYYRECKQDHWRWLQQQRPGLQLISENINHPS
ncbi:hypothetical protein BC939DRAFT_33345 [Gamsiella multidivaricata]|uniref:uncharacterized protein n=1 Tax=Gamsiella multidivaricata TaxID=101098 RepID=UPI00221FD4F3|nr:uncharacterized protein BC939DRAFT_33345 [Gamsiella multidivaricata]KAG0370611.1 hypothetical protein BGZ54_005314 [Gamsiella multidivaricata]KAI7816671.1 hypothetical protein BC939DRAFT_33345 [Gamsiella multidivaricata]